MSLSRSAPAIMHVAAGPTAEEDPPSSSGSDDADTTSTGGGAGLHGSASVSSGLGDDLQPPPGVSWKKSKAKKKQQVWDKASLRLELDCRAVLCRAVLCRDVTCMVLSFISIMHAPACRTAAAAVALVLLHSHPRQPSSHTLCT
jgi:hypothetical protein